MKTTRKHVLTATHISAGHHTWGDFKDRITVDATEVIGVEEDKLNLVLTAGQAKDLMAKLRNSLIDAKVIRGKKSW